MKIITSYLSRSKIQIAKILLIWVQERSFLRSGSQNSLVGVYKISYLEVSKISFNAKRAGLGLGGGGGRRLGDLGTSLAGKKEEDFRSQLASQEISTSQSSLCPNRKW